MRKVILTREQQVAQKRQPDPVQRNLHGSLAMRLLLVLLFTISIFSNTAPGVVHAATTILRVTPTGTANSNCGEMSNWSNPCSLQAALSRANSNPFTDLWVKEGVYYPSTNGNPNDSFQMASGVKVLGGFAGTETSLAQRTFTPVDGNYANDHYTILSGDIKQTPNDNTDNSYHVVTIQSRSVTVVLDHLIITSGHADGSSSDSYGGGIYISNSSVYISSSKFINNTSKLDGGGLFAETNSTVKLVSSQVINNTAGSNGGGAFAKGSNMTFLYTLFYNNASGTSGDGAFAGIDGNLTIIDSIFWANPGSDPSIDIQAKSEKQTQSIILANSIVDGGCPTGVICPTSVITQPNEPFLNTIQPVPPVMVAGVQIPIITIPSNSTFYNNLAPNVFIDDPYNLNGDTNFTDFPYDINGGIIPPKPTAVTLYDFNAAPEANGIQLSWETATEINNIGFNLYRSTADGLEFSQLNPTLVESQSPGGLLGASYTFFDTIDTDHSYVYRLQALDVDGSTQSFNLLYQPATSTGSSDRRIFLPLLSRH